MRALFVTGTDTGAGKTFVACALARALRASGRTVAVLKPVETGVDRAPEDAVALAAAAGDRAPLADICPYPLRAPLAPVVAARIEDVTIDVERLVDLVYRRAAAADILLIEGAGGLLVPIAEGVTWLDLAMRVAVPLLIVAANRLGAINHTALTARAAQAAGLKTLGFVLSAPDPVPDRSASSNAEIIQEVTGLRLLASIGHGAAAVDAMTAAMTSPPMARWLTE